MVQVVAEALVTEEFIVALVAKIVASPVQKEVSEAAQQYIDNALLPLPPSFDVTSSTDNDWKERNPEKNLRQTKESWFSGSEDRGVWSEICSISTQQESSCLITGTSTLAHNLYLIHSVHAAFADAVK